MRSFAWLYSIRTIERQDIFIWARLPITLKPRLRGTRVSEGLAIRSQLAKLHFWKSRQVFPYQPNSQNFFKFYCHFLGRRERGVDSVPLAFAKKFSSFTHWLKNGGVLRRSGRGGLRNACLIFIVSPTHIRSCFLASMNK